jgi:hypothetical protein
VVLGEAWQAAEKEVKPSWQPEFETFDTMEDFKGHEISLEASSNAPLC